MKKIMVLIVTFALVAGMSSMALAKSYSGEVTKVSGDKITIDVGSDADDFAKGDTVKMKVKKGSKPSAKASALVGC